MLSKKLKLINNNCVKTECMEKTSVGIYYNGLGLGVVAEIEKQKYQNGTEVK